MQTPAPLRSAFVATLAVTALVGPPLACRSADPGKHSPARNKANSAAANNPESASVGGTGGDASNDEAAKGATKGPGSGMPDETNGVCRLYAAQLPFPDCCRHEFGFDAVKAAEICGLEVYLGESMHQTCGYHYRTADDSGETFFRLSAVEGETVEAAVHDHDRIAQKQLKLPDFKSTAIPGVEGAFWSRAPEAGMNWAFIPGWDVVRRVTWQDTSCSREDVPKLLAQIIAAKQPEPGTERAGLIPVAR